MDMKTFQWFSVLGCDTNLLDDAVGIGGVEALFTI